MYEVHAKLNTGKEIIRNFGILTSVKDSRSRWGAWGIYEGTWYVNAIIGNLLGFFVSYFLNLL